MRDHPNFDPEALKHEISIMRAINHPRCINLIEVSVGRRVSFVEAHLILYRQLPSARPGVAGPAVSLPSAWSKSF